MSRPDGREGDADRGEEHAPGDVQTPRPELDLDELQRLRRVGMSRLVASVAHDVRGAVASLIYSADFLEARCAEMGPDALRETVREIYDASRRLQLTVDGLLDYAQLGPVISVPVSLQEVLHRAHGLLRSFHREGALRLRVEVTKGADWVRGNPVIVEQIFVNLLLMVNDADVDAAGTPGAVSVRTSTPGARNVVQVHVSTEEPRDDVSADGRATYASSVARSALHDAQVAAESQGGRLLREQTARTSTFLIELPRCVGPR